METTAADNHMSFYRIADGFFILTENHFNNAQMLPDTKTSKRDNHDFIATVFF